VKRIAGFIVLLVLSTMVLFPVVTLAADPPDMEVTIVAVSPGDLTVYVNGDQLANQADIATLRGQMTGSSADLWMWDMVHSLEDYAHTTGVNINLLMDAQAQTILLNQAQQATIDELEAENQNMSDELFGLRIEVKEQEDVIMAQKRVLEQNNALLLRYTKQSAQWVRANNEYWAQRVGTLESRLVEIETREPFYVAIFDDSKVMYGSMGLLALLVGLGATVGLLRKRSRLLP